MNEEIYNDIKDILFNDSNIRKYLQINSIEDCTDYIKDKYSTDKKNYLFVFYSILDQADIDFVAYLSIIDEAVPVLCDNDLSKYTNLKSVDPYAFHDMGFGHSFILPPSIETISTHAFCGAEFDKGLFISTKHLRVCASDAFIAAQGPITIDNDTFDLSANRSILANLTKKNVKIT